MEKKHRLSVWTARIVAALLVLMAVAAAAFFAGTVVAKRSSAPAAPTGGAAPASDLVQRVSSVAGVTRAVEGVLDGGRMLYVVVERGDLGLEKRRAFLLALSGAVEGELPRERIVLVNEKGGDVLPWVGGGDLGTEAGKDN